jgi:hypothetical protein
MGNSGPFASHISSLACFFLTSKKVSGREFAYDQHVGAHLRTMNGYGVRKTQIAAF